MLRTAIDNLLFIDIETVPACAEFDDLSEEWKKLWEEKVKKTVPENETVASFYSQRAGVMAEFSKIICISIGFCRREGKDLQLRIKSFAGDDEPVLLIDFLTTLKTLESGKNNWSFCGHNIREFDIPFICRRILINGLALPACLDFQNMKPWETNLVDTFQYWRFGDYKNFTSLKLLAAVLGIPSPKDDIDGSQVAEVYWKEKNLQRIVTYCQKDVATTANIVMRFNNLPLIGPDSIILVSGKAV